MLQSSAGGRLDRAARRFALALDCERSFLSGKNFLVKKFAAIV